MTFERESGGYPDTDCGPVFGYMAYRSYASRPPKGKSYWERERYPALHKINTDERLSMSEESTEIARFGEQAVKEFNPNDKGAFADLFIDGDSIAGFDLLKEELLDELVGVPFAVVKMTFRPGARDKTTKILRAYVSLECVIAPEEALQRRKVDMSRKPFEPLDMVVLNDGSTGIYRQCLKYLVSKGFIELPEGKEDGPSGETVYDLPPHLWKEVHNGEGRGDEETEFIHYSVNVKLNAPRGLRLSPYSNEYGDATTRYFA